MTDPEGYTDANTKILFKDNLYVLGDHIFCRRFWRQNKGMPLLAQLRTVELAETIFDEAISLALFPRSWQETCLVLLFKKNNFSHLYNCHPFALINADTKIFKRLLSQILMLHFDKLISPHQLVFPDILLSHAPFRPPTTLCQKQSILKKLTGTDFLINDFIDSSLQLRETTQPTQDPCGSQMIPIAAAVVDTPLVIFMFITDFTCHISSMLLRYQETSFLSQ